MQFSCHSMAVVPTPVQTEQIRINIHKWNNTKNTVQTIQNTVNTSAHTTKTPTNTLQNPHLHTPTHKHTHTHTNTYYKTSQNNHSTRYTKWNSHCTAKYPKYKFNSMYMVILSQSYTSRRPKNKLISRGITDTLDHCFSTFVRPRPGKFFFHKTRARSQQIYS